MIYQRIKSSRKDYTVGYHTPDMASDLPYIEQEYGYCVQLAGIEYEGRGKIKSTEGDAKILSAFIPEDNFGMRVPFSATDIDGNLGSYQLASLSDICSIFQINNESFFRSEGRMFSLGGEKNPLVGAVLQKNPHLTVQRYTKDVAQNNNQCLVEIRRPYTYMFDSKFAKLVSGPDVRVVPLYIARRNMGINRESGEFNVHMVYCKTKKKMQAIRRYFEKHYNLNSIMIYREASEHYVISRYKKVQSLAGADTNIKVGDIQNKNMMYAFKISLRRAREIGEEDRIHSMLYEKEELHCDLKVNVNRERSEVYVYARDDKIINKMKLLNIWKDIITEITINDVRAT